MALRMDGAGENFHSRDPSLRNFRIGPICARQLAGLDANLRDPLGKRAHAIIAHRERGLRFRGRDRASGRVCFCSSQSVYLPNEKSARSRERFGL